MQQLQSAVGVFALLGFAWAISENRRAVSLRQASIGLAATFLTALLFLKIPQVATAMGAINRAVDAIAAASRAGTSFVFGYLGGGTLPFELKVPGADFVLAFQALSVVRILSVLTTLLFYWRILPPVGRGMAWLLERTLGVGGAVGLSTAANIFLGMVEAPLFIRPYLGKLSRAELFLVMTGGMAGIAGTVLVLYATLLAPLIPDAAAHFVIASVLGAPAAILISLIMVPETSGQRTGGALEDPDLHASSTMDAIVKGTTAGLELLLNIIAVLIVLVALVYLGNAVLGLLPNIGGAGFSLQRILELAMPPVCWRMRVIPRQRNAAVDRERTLPLWANRIDHGDVEEAISFRQCGPHHPVERENIRQYHVIGAGNDTAQVCARQYRRQAGSELHGRAEQHGADTKPAQPRNRCLDIRDHAVE